MDLLVYFAIPLATIILSAILESLIRCPLKVVGIFFSIFLVTAAALGSTIELFFAAIIYTIISFITAFIVHFILCRYEYDLIGSNCNTLGTVQNSENHVEDTVVNEQDLLNNSEYYRNCR